MNIKELLRKVRIIIGKRFLDKKTVTSEAADNSVYKKFLFLRQDGKIGDYIVSSFVFRELKKYDPSIQIDVICTAKNDDLFKQNPYVDHIYLIKTRSIIDAIKCGLKLRKNKYDVIIDPTLMIRNRHLLLLRLINAKNYVGYQKADYRIFNYNIEQTDLHYSAIYEKTLAILGFERVDSNYDIPHNIQAEQDINIFIQQNQLTDFIAVNFFGAGNKRTFSESNIRQFLAFFAQQKNKKFVLLTFPAVTEKLKRFAEGYANIFIFENTKNIFHTIELIRQANLLISPDTSTVHIGAGLNKPMIVFYSTGKENFMNWHPNNKNITHILYYQKNINEIHPEQIKPYLT